MMITYEILLFSQNSFSFLNYIYKKTAKTIRTNHNYSPKHV
jgi:hypothetical protein